MDAKVEEAKERKKLNSLLLVACERGLYDDVVELVHRGADLDVKDSLGRSTLHLAAARGRQEIVEYLWSKAAVDLENEDVGGKTPLHLASANGHASTVEFLLKKGALVDSIDGSSSTALHMAACRGEVEVIKTLLDHKANVGMVNDACLTPLGIATLSGQSDCVKTLLPTFVPHAAGEKLLAYSPVHAACMCGDGDILDIVLEKSNGGLISNNSNPTRSTPLHCAAFSGNAGSIRKILGSGGEESRSFKDSEGRMPSDCVPKGCDGYDEIKELVGMQCISSEMRCRDDQGDSDSTPEKTFHLLSDAEKKSKLKRWMMMAPGEPSLLKAINNFDKANDIKLLLEKARKLDKMIKIHNAYSHVRNDKQFQEDLQDPEISGTVESLRRDTSQYEHYASQPRIGSVLRKLQSLHGDLKSFGEQSLRLDLALAKDIEAAASEDNAKRKQLQDQLHSCLVDIENLCQAGVGVKDIQKEDIDDTHVLESTPIQWKAMMIRNTLLLLLITIIGLALKYWQVS